MTNLFRVTGVTALLGAVACSAASPSDEDSTSATVTNSSSAIVSAIGSRCLDDNANAQTNGNKIQIWGCNGGAAQQWSYVNGALVNAGGKCLDIPDDKQISGSAVQLYTCNGTDAQKWSVEGTAIKSTSGLCLDVRDGANGTIVQLYACNGTPAQSWKVSGATSAPDSGAPAPIGNAKYLSKLGAKCNGSDDSAAVISAVAGARNNAYTLIVDCAATLDIGLNVDRSVFIDNDTTVQFQGAGKFIVNNLFEPAFVIANTSNVTLTDWNVEFDASMPVSLATNGYIQAGVYHERTGGNGSGIFNDVILSGWLSKNRGIDFVDGPTHGIWSNWLGSVNTSAIFYITGETTNVKVTGLKLYSANTSEPSDYIPFGFMFGENFKSNQSVTVDTVKYNATNASDAFAIPTGITFDDVNLDGIIMGFQGNTSDATFSNLTVEHVSDLQDLAGNNVGGVGQSFPPPHLFYLNYGFDGDPKLANTNITITNVDEVGPRMGKVRPGGGGYADSLKLGCNDCTVDGYKTNRKDGFMDVLTSNGLKVSNVVATYDSSFVDEYENWPGWRWPGGGTNGSFKNVSFTNVSLTDLAAVTVAAPLSNANAAGNANISFTHVSITVQSWTKGNIVPTFTGLAANALVDFDLLAQKETQTLKP